VYKTGINYLVNSKEMPIFSKINNKGQATIVFFARLLINLVKLNYKVPCLNFTE